MLNVRVLLPLATIFAIQALMTMAAYGISVIIPDAAEDIGIPAKLVGYLSGTLYLSAMITGPLTSTLVRRFGPTRLFQILITLTACGALALMGAHPVLAFLGALIIGIGTGPMNPTGSHVLAGATPAPWLPMVFSIKQCGTPAGGMLAGALLPPIALLYDWRLALALLPITAVVLLVLAPFGQLGQRDDEPPGHRTGSVTREVMDSLRSAVATRALTTVCLTGAGLGACQLSVAAYYVVYLWSAVGMSTTEAGQMFVVFHIVGILARLALGAIAERWIPTRYLLPGLGLVMACGTALAIGFSPDTSRPYIYVVTVLLGIGGNGWVGLYFAELARLAPDRAALVAGGAQFVMFLGIVIGPVVFASILALTDSYVVAFTCFTGLALLSGISLLLPATYRSR